MAPVHCSSRRTNSHHPSPLTPHPSPLTPPPPPPHPITGTVPPQLDAAGNVVSNKFTELPVVGGWGRRPLELATLRLQNMLGISLKGA